MIIRVHWLILSIYWISTDSLNRKSNKLAVSGKGHGGFCIDYYLRQAHIYKKYSNEIFRQIWLITWLLIVIDLHHLFFGVS